MPTKEDFITQIKADLKADTEPSEVLKERLAKVKAAKTDEAAEKAYFDDLERVANDS